MPRPEIGGYMHRSLRFPTPALLLISFCSFCMLLPAPGLIAQDSKVMGELKLKGDKKLLLLPGRHQITVRQSGYSDFVRDVVVEPGQVQKVQVAMPLIPGARPPAITAELKLTVDPGRAAVFVDDNYAGHASEFGGHHSLLISPGKHHIRVALAGYQTFETEVSLLTGQKSEVKTELLKGSIEQASSDIKKDQNIQKDQ